MPKKYTAKTFQPTLLAVLGELSGYAAYHPIPMREAIAAVLRRMDLAEDALGTKHGKLETHRLIGLAFRGAKTMSNPLAASERKGQWALTERGVEQARQALPTPAKPQTRLVRTSESESSYGATAEEKAPDTRHVYEADPYIRSLAIQQTPCFGLYDGSCASCKTCILARHCRTRFWEHCAALAELPETSTELPAAAAATGSAARPMGFRSDEPSIDENELALTEDQIARAQSMTSSSPLDCQKCEQPIRAGSKCFFIAPLGGFHLDCFHALKGKQGATT